MVLAGAIAIVAALLPLSSGRLAAILIVTVAAAALIPIVYSFLLWRRAPRRTPAEAAEE